jgi:hypothetical protein
MKVKLQFSLETSESEADKRYLWFVSPNSIRIRIEQRHPRNLQSGARVMFGGLFSRLKL